MNSLVPLASIAVLSLTASTIASTRDFYLLQDSTPVQAASPAPIGAAQKRQAVVDLAKLLRSRYCIASIAEQAAALIERKLADGGYDALADAEAFAQAMTTDLQSITKDKHVRFGVATPPPASANSTSQNSNAEGERAARKLALRRGNYGLVKAEILVGNVGYLEVRRFQSPDLAGDTVMAALQFLANAEAVIVDLRNCHGGSPYAMPIFAGYFVERPTHLFDMEFRGDEYTDHFWTAAWLPGKRLAGIPMYILTSAYTFSGAEGLAYRFKVLKRATIVGETTGGGANAGGVLDVAPFFQVWMPMGRPVDRDTSTNWEGTGVVPDIRASAREALAVAHVEALKALRAKSADDKDKARLDWAIVRAAASYTPQTVSAQDFDRFSGWFGKNRVWVEGGQLRFQPENESTFLLQPLGGGVFTSETNDPIQVEFVPSSSEKAQKLVFTDEDGGRHEFRRTQ